MTSETYAATTATWSFFCPPMHRATASSEVARIRSSVKTIALARAHSFRDDTDTNVSGFRPPRDPSSASHQKSVMIQWLSQTYDKKKDRREPCSSRSWTSQHGGWR